MTATHRKPALHNAMWPGLVGKGGPGAEPPIDLDTMLDLTAEAQVDGTRFDGVDLFLFDPHVSIDSSNDDLQRVLNRLNEFEEIVRSSTVIALSNPIEHRVLPPVEPDPET